MKHLLRLETISLVLVLVAGTVGAQDAPQPRLTDQLALARICASEIGLTGAPEECAAIHEVLRDRMRRQGWSFLTAARLYSGRVFDTSRTDARAWVADLSPHARQPRGWPVAFASWSSYGRPRWQALYEASGRILVGEITHGCEILPAHWGCRTCGDSARARRAGWQEVTCWVPCESENGEPARCESRNAFWAIPGRSADAD